MAEPEYVITGPYEIVLDGPHVGFVGPPALLDSWRIEAKNRRSVEGGVLSRKDYPELYAMIGKVYGEGETDDEFRLPDFRGRTRIDRQL